MSWSVSPPFELIPRSVIFPGQSVASSNGALRPPLVTPAKYFTIHFVGSGSFADFGDSIPELRGIQSYAVSQNKPWMYNWVTDSEGNVLEYAGVFRGAHSAGENGEAIGILLLFGIGEPKPAATVLSVRKLIWWLKELGLADDATEIRPHSQMPGASTPCPGDEAMKVWGELTRPWTPEEEPMLFKPYEGPRLLDTRRPPGAPFVPRETRVYRAPVPAGAKVAVLNLAAIGPRGFVTAWRHGVRRPETSNVNPDAGVPRSNLAFVPVDEQGRFNVYSHNGGDLVVDAQGWFA